jgi:hypothetical protein
MFGCLGKLVLLTCAGLAFAWALLVLLNPWALHIGGRSTPLLYWHGAGTVVSKDGKSYPLYVYFFPGRPGGFHSGGRREGKIVSADLDGGGWLCVAPGQTLRLSLSGTMYGGYSSMENSLFDFRLLEWRKPFAINPQFRGFFDLAGMFHGPDLIMDRPNEQGIRFKSGLFFDDATAKLTWTDYDDFVAGCRNSGKTALLPR